MKTIQNLNANKKGYIDFCRQTPSLPSKWYCPSTNDFLLFSPKKLLSNKIFST